MEKRKKKEEAEMEKRQKHFERLGAEIKKELGKLTKADSVCNIDIEDRERRQSKSRI